MSIFYVDALLNAAFPPRTLQYKALGGAEDGD